MRKNTPMRDEQHEHHAYTDEMLDACLLGRLAPTVAKEIDAWAHSDPKAAKRIAQAQQDIDAIRSGLDAICENPSETSLDDLTLAMYLDDALEPHERARVETRLSQSPSACQRLILLYQTTRAIADPEFSIPVLERRCAGEQLDFRAECRSADDPPSVPAPSQCNGPDGNGEERKQRYSSERS
jgi:hypothetical protein